MPLALNANAIINCSHMGTFKFIPSAMTVMINGAPPVVLGDTAVPQTPCPFATAAGPAPCIQLTPAPMVGASAKVMVQGRPLLLQHSQWMTIPAGAGVPVPAMVMMPGTMTVNVNG